MRFRPILMTTAAAIDGRGALALGQGTGSELRQPLGYAMSGIGAPAAPQLHNAPVCISISTPAEVAARKC